MGDERDGRFVSGVGIAAAGGATSAPPPPPLTVHISWSGQTPLPVAGASGVAQTVGSPFAPNVLAPFVSGGVPPYIESSQLVNNTSGKLSIAAAPDGVHNTIAWSDFAINEVESTDITYRATDSAGTTVTSTYTGIIVQRTS
jgi:hypothetical protein